MNGLRAVLRIAYNTLTTFFSFSKNKNFLTCWITFAIAGFRDFIFYKFQMFIEYVSGPSPTFSFSLCYQWHSVGLALSQEEVFKPTHKYNKDTKIILKLTKSEWKSMFFFHLQMPPSNMSQTICCVAVHFQLIRRLSLLPCTVFSLGLPIRNITIYKWQSVDLVKKTPNKKIPKFQKCQNTVCSSAKTRCFQEVKGFDKWKCRKPDRNDNFE